MTEEDENRLIESLKEEWNEGHRTWEQNMLRLAKAARDFRESGELRCGDEVQVSDLISTVGKVTYIGPTPYGNHIVNTQNSGLIHVDNVKLKPKSERRLMGQVALMQWFTDHGWKPDKHGIYCNRNFNPKFTPVLWQYCGCKASDVPFAFGSVDDWFEEVEVGR